MSVLAEFKGGILDRERRWLMWCDAETVFDNAAELGAFALPTANMPASTGTKTMVCPPGDEEGWPEATRYQLAEVLEGIAVYEVLTTPA